MDGKALPTKWTGCRIYFLRGVLQTIGRLQARKLAVHRHANELSRQYGEDVSGSELLVIMRTCIWVPNTCKKLNGEERRKESLRPLLDIWSD